MDKKVFERKAKEVLVQSKADIDNLTELTKPIAPENAIGRISRMDAINNRAVNEAALRVLQEKVKKIENALKKINDKDFGTCRKCKQPIPEGRLLLIPGAVCCVNCA